MLADFSLFACACNGSQIAWLSGFDSGVGLFGKGWIFSVIIINFFLTIRTVQRMGLSNFTQKFEKKINNNGCVLV